MLRSPAEYFIKYLASYAHWSDVKVLDKALASGVDEVPGGVDYIKHLRKNMRFPLNFDPRNRWHRESMDFLMKEGIYDMWHPSEATEQAGSLFRSGELRESVCTMLATPMSVEAALEQLAKKVPLEISGQTLREFKHYYWNLALLSEEDRRYYMKSPRKSRLIRLAISTYKDALGPALLSYKMGHMPPRIPRVDFLYAIRDISFMNGLEVDRTMDQGNQKSNALRNYFELGLAAQGKIDGTESQEATVINEFYRALVVAKQKFDPPTRAQLNIKEVPNENAECPQLAAGTEEGDGGEDEGGGESGD